MLEEQRVLQLVLRSPSGSGTAAMAPSISSGAGWRDLQRLAEEVARAERELVIAAHDLGPAAGQERAHEAQRVGDAEPRRRIERAGPVELEDGSGCDRARGEFAPWLIDRRTHAARGGSRARTETPRPSARRPTCAGCRRSTRRRSRARRAAGSPARARRRRACRCRALPARCTMRSTGKISAVWLVT